MIPSTATQLSEDFTTATQPEKTYRLVGSRIVGHVDGREAVEQAARLILETERFTYSIFSWNYGVELRELLGLQPPILFARLEDTISEALLQDDRILDVNDFGFTQSRGIVTVTCRAETLYGDIHLQAKKAVENYV